MRELFSVFVSVLFLLAAGCAGVSTSAPDCSPRAGLTLIINKNQSAYAHCRLFEGSWSQEDLIIAGEDGQPKWAKQEIMSFKICPSFSSDFLKTEVLHLAPRAEYTLFIIWTKFTGQILNMDAVRFSTSGNPFRESHTGMFGEKTYADKIVYLPYVNVNAVSQIKIHKTLYLADWLKALVGLP